MSEEIYDKKAIGFKPSEKCPICKRYHAIEYLYQNIPVLVCPDAPPDGIVFSPREHVHKMVDYFKTICRVTK